jgi:hypothetical protein
MTTAFEIIKALDSASSDVRKQVADHLQAEVGLPCLYDDIEFQIQEELRTKGFSVTNEQVDKLINEVIYSG